MKSTQATGRWCARGFPCLRWVAAAALVTVLTACNSVVHDPDGTHPSLDEPLAVVDPPPDGNDVVPGGGGPEARVMFSARRAFCCNPLSVEFRLEAPEGVSTAGVRAMWDFGDNKSRDGLSVGHTYSREGRYRVVVTLVWPDGRVETVTGAIDVGRDTGNDDLRVDPSGNEERLLHANAGPDQEATSGAIVVLDGTGSTFDAGLAPAAHWTQLLGPTVAMTSADPLVATFTAPATDSDVVLTFRLTLRSATEAVHDDVSVLVRAADPDNHPPQGVPAVAFVAPGSSVRIILNGRDPDGDDLSFAVASSPNQGRLGRIEKSGREVAAVTYTAASDARGEDGFTFTVHDGLVRSVEAGVTISFDVSGDGLSAHDGRALVPVNTRAVLVLRGTDAENDDLTFEIVEFPQYGDVVEIDNGARDTARVTYAPRTGFHGIDRFTFRVQDGQGASQEAVFEITVNKLLLPWNEVNAPWEPASKYFTEEQGAREGMTVFDFALAGIRNWARVTHTVVITTTGSNVRGLYDALRREMPRGLTVIGGFKTASYLPPDDFAYEAGWLTILEKARLTVQHTGVNVVLLDNETALEMFHGRRAGLDLDRLRAALRPLAESGIQFWWWMPAVLRDREYWDERREATAELTRVVLESVPNSKFVTGYTGWKDWERGVFDEPALREQMISIVGAARFFDRHLVTRTGRRMRGNQEADCYTAATSLEAMQRLINAEFILYPGASQWILTSEDYAVELPNLAETRSPYAQ